VTTCDAADASDVCALLQEAAGSTSIQPLGGVLHAAGAGDKGLISVVNRSRLDWMFASKALGAWHVHSCTMATPLRSFVLFSSIGSGLGNVGQANYAAANAALDACALSRRAHGASASSLQLPLVGGAGMGAAAFDERQMSFKGMAAITLDAYAACLGDALAPSGSLCSVQLVMSSESRSMLQSVADASQPRFTELATRVSENQATRQLERVVDTMSISSKEVSLEMVLEIVRRTAGGAVDADAPLMESGIDSLGAVELRNQLQQAAGENLALPSTLIFDHPTARQLTTALLPLTTSEALPGAEMRASSTSPSSHVTPLATTQAASDRQSSNGPRSISSRVTFIKDSSDRFPPVRPEHPSLRLVRKAKMGTLPSRPPIVLVHGIDGHVDGFGFYRTQCHDHDILALVPADPDAMTDPLQMIDEYTKACVSHFGTSTAFHMIGYSFGAMLARCIAGNVAEAGGCPLGLVFLDPPPFFQAQEKQNVERRRSAARSALLMTLPQVVQDPEVSLEEIINDEFPDLHQVRDAEVVTYIIGEAFATKPLTTVLAELNALNQLINTMAFCAENAMPHMAGCHLHREIPVKVMVALASPEVRSSFFISRGSSAEDLSEECYHATIELQVPGDHFRAVAICATGWHDEFNDALRDFLSAIETTPKEEN
jgi:thioesterase domain-containing protein